MQVCDSEHNISNYRHNYHRPLKTVKQQGPARQAAQFSRAQTGHLGLWENDRSKKLLRSTLRTAHEAADTIPQAP